MQKVRILTKLRTGIKDVEGEAILKSVGKDSGITHISVGQMFIIEIEDNADIDQIAKNIFVNDLIYDYEYEILKIC